MALYSFITGKIRVLERNLINQTDIDRLVDAPDFKAAFKALNDTDYGAHLLDVEPTQFKDALESDFQEVRNLLVQWIEDNSLLEFMFLHYDAHNIKLYLKIKYSGRDQAEEFAEKYSSDAGLTVPALIKKIILDEQKDTVLHSATELLLQQSLERLPSEPTGFEIDSTVDLVMFEMLNDRVQKQKQIIKDLYKIQKETAWVKTFLRAKILGKTLDEIKSVLPESFLRHYDLELDQAIEALPIDVRIKKAYQNYLEHKLLWEFEKELEEAELSVIRDAKYATSGPEPAVGYFYAKKNAIRNLRLILTAKMNDIPAAEIKPRVRELY